LAYFGAAYYNNEDPLQNLKNLFGQEQTSHTVANDDGQTYDQGSTIEQLRAENARLKSRVEALEAEVRQLREQSSSNANREPWGNNN
jgi:cell division protein FtsB